MGPIEILIPVLAILVGGAIVLMPLAAFCARFALKPIMEAIAEVRERGSRGEAQLRDSRVELLEAEVQSLRATVEKLDESERFRRQLEDGGATRAVR